MTKPQSAEEQIVANLKAQHAALVARDTEALAKLFTPGFTRTHFTGKQQSKEQWLKQISSKEISYHSFEYESIKVDVEGTHATLVAKVTNEATLYGQRKPWKIKLRQSFLKTDGVWLCSRTVATPW